MLNDKFPGIEAQRESLERESHRLAPKVSKGKIVGHIVIELAKTLHAPSP